MSNRVVLSIPEDFEVVEWMHENVDDMSITRDQTRGAEVTITFCHPLTTCQVSVTKGSLRQAVWEAMRICKVVKP